MKVHQDWVDLNIYATMGNATTFPVETLLFWAYALATARTLEPGLSIIPDVGRFKEASVFGDDVILGTNVVDSYMEVLESIGFEVNANKTHSSKFDPFRESCGYDFSAGVPSRPLFLKRPADSSLSAFKAWLCQTWNQVIEKYILYFGPRNYVYDKHALRVLEGLFAEYEVHPYLIPDYLPEDAGLYATDGDRLFREYPAIEPDPPKYQNGEDGDGWLFHYFRFVYPEKHVTVPWFDYHATLRGPASLSRLDRSSYLHRSVFTSLKHDTELEDEWDCFSWLRRRGSYVVAKGLTSCWTPDLALPVTQ
jgi:hypothetical protein